MARRAVFDTIDLHLVRVLQTLISEGSVSRAAMRLASTRPVVSARPKRLRSLTGDPLLVRAGQQMLPTATALQPAGPAASSLHAAEALFGAHARDSHGAGFDPAVAAQTLRVRCPVVFPTLNGDPLWQAPTHTAPSKAALQ